MIADILLIIWSTFMFVLWLVLLPLKLILDLTNLTTDIGSMISFMFTPLSYFGFWINTQAIGTFVVNMTSFLTVWYIWKLVKMGLETARGTRIDNPKI